MPSKIKSSRLRPHHLDEMIVLESELGRVEHLYIPVSESATRQATVDAALAEMDRRDHALREYAATHGVSLSSGETPPG